MNNSASQKEIITPFCLANDYFNRGMMATVGIFPQPGKKLKSCDSITHGLEDARAFDKYVDIIVESSRYYTEEFKEDLLKPVFAYCNNNVLNKKNVEGLTRLRSPAYNEGLSDKAKQDLEDALYLVVESGADSDAKCSAKNFLFFINKHDATFEVSDKNVEAMLNDLTQDDNIEILMTERPIDALYAIEDYYVDYSKKYAARNRPTPGN